MDYNPIELRRETIFKDAVLSAAQTKGMSIISEAQQESAKELAQAQALCEEADHAVIAQSLSRDSEKEHSAALQAARASLLAHRAQLVDGLFEDVKAELAAFTASKDYPAWLAARATKYADLAGGKPKVALRAADLKHKAAIQKALPGAEVAEDDTILIGGLRTSDGRVLYDETLDAALADEREHFYQTSGLCL